MCVFREVDIVGVVGKWITKTAPGWDAVLGTHWRAALSSSHSVLCSHTGPVAHSVRLCWRMLSMVARSSSEHVEHVLSCAHRSKCRMV